MNLKDILDWFKEAEKPVAVEAIVVTAAKTLKKAVKQCQKLQPELTEETILKMIMDAYTE